MFVSTASRIQKGPQILIRLHPELVTLDEAGQLQSKTWITLLQNIRLKGLYTKYLMQASFHPQFHTRPKASLQTETIVLTYIFCSLCNI